MRSINRLLITTALAAAVSTSRASAQVEFDTLDVKPMVMLLVDTSGSMERMPGTNDLPNCSSADPALKKNRWAVTIEALTGTFDTFTCKERNRSSAADGFDDDDYDFGYYLPHYDFIDPDGNGVLAAQTGNNGILDVFKQRAKFGVMSFDGVGTTLGGSPLMDNATFQASESDSDGIYGVYGMYSYGETKPLVFPGCNTTYYVNAGGRRAPVGLETIPGGMVSVSQTDSTASILAANQAVQDSLLYVRPFGGTPTAALLDDLEYWFENNETVRPKTGPSDTGGDEFYSCRDRYGVLITDGAPDKLFRDARYNCGVDPAECAPLSCVCPYDHETDIAARLISDSKLKKLFVVAFDVDDDAQAEVDAIAAAGNTVQAFSASTPEALRSVLDNLMTSVTPASATRTAAITVSTSGSAFRAGKQYEIKAGFQKGETGDDPWRGVLERRRIQCDFNLSPPQPVAQPIRASEGDEFHTTLSDRSFADRNIVTVVPPSAMANRGTILNQENLLDDVPNNPTAALSQTAYTGEALETSLTTTNPSAGVQSTWADDLSSIAFRDTSAVHLGVTSAEFTKIQEYVSGKSREDNKLSDVYHSTPVALPSLDFRGGSPIINNFRRSIITDPSTYRGLRKLTDADSGYTSLEGRPPVIFVGSNDGVLHAFNLDTWQGKTESHEGGEELWGFIPPALFPKLRDAALPSHQFMFDGQPVVRDMILRQNRENLTQKPELATVLLAPVRGAAAYIALDVTLVDDPPVFMWQISDPDMGNTVATPALTQVDVRVSGVVQRRAVAILPGGEGAPATTLPLTTSRGKFGKATAPADARASGRRWESTVGRTLLIVDVATGQVLRKFDADHFPAPLSGSVTTESARFDVSSRAYFTDDDGVLWRLSMASSNADDWVVEPIWDVFAGEGADDGQPSSFAPVLTRDQQGNNVIILGTGSLDNTADANAKNFVVSLTEKELTVNASGRFTSEVEANWVLELDDGELVTGPLSLLNGVVYFGTFKVSDDGDKCNPGQSRLWGVDYVEVASDDLPRARLDEAGEFVRYVDPTANDGDPSNDGKLVLGVSIARSPVCVPGVIENNAVTGTRFVQQGQAGGGMFTVRGMISGASTASNASNSSIGSFEREIKLPQVREVVGFASSIE